MSKTNGDEAAFAKPDTTFLPSQKGLTKREYFAALALQGLLAKGITFNATATVETAVKCADSLIEELNK